MKSQAQDDMKGKKFDNHSKENKGHERQNTIRIRG